MTISFETLRRKWMKDPKFRAEYERIGPEMDLAMTLAEARRKAELRGQQRGFTGTFEIVAAERPGVVAEKRRPISRRSGFSAHCTWSRTHSPQAMKAISASRTACCMGSFVAPSKVKLLITVRITTPLRTGAMGSYGLWGWL
jgi:hypothetical protein